MKLCPTCGFHCEDKARFCPSCGTSVEGVVSEDKDPLTGTVIANNFRVEEVIGVGAMGTVYKAEQISLGKTISVKVLHPHLTGDPTLAKRFHREAKAASLLNHANCIQVIDFGMTEAGLMYIAMEFLDGQDLAELIHNDYPLEPTRTLHIAKQICQALDEAHAANVIHRDLKPENVMIIDTRTQKDFVKVLDFGIAKLQDPGLRDSFQTMTGIVCGTPEYMAPEQARGEKLDARADLYAMGIILYQMFTNQLPFLAESAIGVVTKHLTERPTPPSKIVPTIHPEAERVILKLMEKDKRLRYASALELRTELERLSQIMYQPSSLSGSLRQKATLMVSGDSSEMQQIQQLAATLRSPVSPDNSMPMDSSGQFGPPQNSGAFGPPQQSGSFGQPAPATTSGNFGPAANSGLYGPVSSSTEFQFQKKSSGKTLYIMLTLVFLLLAGGIIYYLVSENSSSSANSSDKKDPQNEVKKDPPPKKAPIVGLTKDATTPSNLQDATTPSPPDTVTPTNKVVVNATPDVQQPINKPDVKPIKVVPTPPPVNTGPDMKTPSPKPPVIVKPTPAPVPKKRKKTKAEELRDLNNRGNRAFKRGRWKHALVYYQKALKLRHSTSILYKIGRTYMRLGNNDKARWYYRRVLKKRPNHPKAPYMRAMIGQ